MRGVRKRPTAIRIEIKLKERVVKLETVTDQLCRDGLFLQPL